MKKIASNSRYAVLLPMGLLVLSMAVFGWGLQYKLSLYQSKNAVSHLTPEAKLLSQKERPAAVQVARQLPSLRSWPLVLVVVLTVALDETDRRYFREQCLDEGGTPVPICPPASLVRPPPAFSFQS